MDILMKAIGVIHTPLIVNGHLIFLPAESR